MPGVCVIVGYRPKHGRDAELLELVRKRVPILREQEPVTDRPPIIMRSRGGTIVEVSEWKWPQAIYAAHRNPTVVSMWQKFFAVCDYIPLKELPEAEEVFAGFEPIDEK